MSKEKQNWIPIDKNPNFCVVPWTHSYLSPQSERRLCCASREKASYIRQYIDRDEPESKEYAPEKLKDYWNGLKMRKIRLKMLRGEKLSECDVCTNQSLNLHTYRQYFMETRFPQLIDKVIESTQEDGSTTMFPISFDYRFSNQCNFKCRMCGEKLSSSWEIEKRKHGTWSEKSNPWMLDENKTEIESFQKNIAENEFYDAIKNKSIEEIYWVGGEPLIWPAHWKYMHELVKNGHSKHVFVRYNTNLSNLSYKKTHLFKDLLIHFQDHNICASLDAVGALGEYLRTGLNWLKWKENFLEAKSFSTSNENQLTIDLTLTLPGLFGLRELVLFAVENDVKVLTKIVFAFDPTKLLSPFALPKKLLLPILEDLILFCEQHISAKQISVLDTLKEMQNRACFEELFPNNWSEAAIKGKQQILNLEKIRPSHPLTLDIIFKENNAVLEWWNQIPNSTGSESDKRAPARCNVDDSNSLVL